MAAYVPGGFADEKALHQLVEEAPQMMPLAGAPRLVVVGSEVQLGTGFADLVAIEPNGRPVVIEIKLSKNAGGQVRRRRPSPRLRGLPQSSGCRQIRSRHAWQTFAISWLGFACPKRSASQIISRDAEDLTSTLCALVEEAARQRA